MHTDRKRIGGTPGPGHIRYIQRVIESGESVVDEDIENNRHIRFVPLYITDMSDRKEVIGAIALVMDRTPILDNVSSLRQRLIWITALSIISVIGILAYLMNRIVVSPVNDLIRATGSIAGGDFRNTVAVSSTDELGCLASTFNRMTQELQLSRNEQAKLLVRSDALYYATRGLIKEEQQVQGLLKKIVDEARMLIDSRYAAIGILNDSGGYDFFIPSGISNSKFNEMYKNHGLPKGKGLLGHLLASKDVVIANDIAKHAASGGFPDGHPEMKNFLGSPILIGDQVIGRLYFADKVDASDFTEFDADTATSFANTAGIAIRNARLLEETRTHKEELQILNSIASTANHTLDMDQMLESVLDEILSFNFL
nr:GAF domain-containing protein [candidate division Zixibacteria bacterium]